MARLGFFMPSISVLNCWARSGDLLAAGYANSGDSQLVSTQARPQNASIITSLHDIFRPSSATFLQLTKESKLSLPAPGFLDQYSSSENGRIFSKVDKKVSFKWDSPWILQSFEIKWVISENNYLKDHGKFLHEIRLKCFKCYTKVHRYVKVH